MEEKKNKINIKLLIIFIALYLFNTIELALNFSAGKLILILITIVPMTILMLINTHVPSLFILILFGVFEIILNLLGVYAFFANQSFNVVSLLIIIISVFMYTLIIDDAIRILRNKEKVNKLYLYIIFTVFLIIMLISFIIDIINSTFTFVLFIESLITFLSSTLLINLYIVYYLNATEFGELEIFK